MEWPRHYTPKQEVMSLIHTIYIGRCKGELFPVNLPCIGGKGRSHGQGIRRVLKETWALLLFKKIKKVRRR